MKELLAVKGEKVIPIEFDSKDFVGVLVFPEYPVIYVYNFDKGIVLLKWWLDCNSSGIERFYIYSVLIDTISKFIHNKISYYQLFTSSRGHDHIIDYKGHKIINCIKIKSYKDIPLEYFPEKEQVMFTDDDGVQLEKIKDILNI